MTDPTKCVRCGAGPRSAIHHDTELEDFHKHVQLQIVADIAPRSLRHYLLVVGAAAVIVAATLLFGWLRG